MNGFQWNRNVLKSDFEFQIAMNGMYKHRQIWKG